MNTSFMSRRGAAITLSAAALLSVTLYAWAETVRGNGKVVTQSRAVSGFTGVGLGLPAEVEVRIGTTEGVTIETDENLLPHIETVVKGGTLEIRAKQDRTNLQSKLMKVVVQARQIDHLKVGGSGSISADTLRSPKLAFDIGGSGNIAVKHAEAEKVAVAIGGSGNAKLSGGKAGKLDVSIAGSGDVVAGSLQADDVDVTIAGSGDATVWARNNLKMSVAGSGDVQYYGHPQVKKSVAGSGSTKQLGAAPN